MNKATRDKLMHLYQESVGAAAQATRWLPAAQHLDRLQERFYEVVKSCGNDDNGAAPQSGGTGK